MKGSKLINLFILVIQLTYHTLTYNIVTKKQMEPYNCGEKFLYFDV